MTEQKTPRGTAAMSPEDRARVAKAGGTALSQNREHMVAIGRRGAAALKAKYGREHFQRIGSLGGIASGERRAEQ